jgi:hypothetical protein
MKLLPMVNKNQRDAERRSRIYRDLLHREAKIGGELFGPIPQNGRREFFWLDGNTWIWHEEWVDRTTALPRVVTTRYDIRPNGVLKSQNNAGYRYVDVPEARRLYEAVKLYRHRVANEVYNVAV